MQIISNFNFLHNFQTGQEEVTTTLAPPASEGPKESSTETPTEAPTSVETTSAAADEAKTEAPSEASTEDKPKSEEKKDETSESSKSIEEAKQPGEEEAQSPPQMPPKFVFVTQHFRDPMTGVVYSRQVPLIPSTYLRPVLPSQPEVRGPQQPPAPEQAAQPQPSFDPLGQYNEQQKKRQFYQDMIMTQLTRFEKEIEPMLESEQNVTEKNDMEELLSTVSELKQKLENHQIFNISEIMNNWKEGKLADGQSEPASSQADQPARAPVGPPPQVAYSRQPQMTLRTVILVPQTRHHQQQPHQPPMQPPQYQQPQYNPQYNPYASMSRHVPVIHIRRTPYQAAMYGAPAEANAQQMVGRQSERGEAHPPTAGEGEYSNGNDIFGYWMKRSAPVSFRHKQTALSQWSIN